MIVPLDINGELETYIKKVYPVGIGKVQRTELQRAWFGAMHLLLCHMLTFAAEEEDGDKELERILRETMQFGRSCGNIGNN